MVLVPESHVLPDYLDLVGLDVQGSPNGLPQEKEWLLICPCLGIFTFCSPQLDIIVPILDLMLCLPPCFETFPHSR
eukprot:12921668-Prorocentrum_lima.AAC.1